MERLNARLGDIGNLKSDGRPILGLDSRDLVEICVEAADDVLFIPAHIWTPHFAVLGASSGFDTLEECFEDMLPAIFAVETGLSSDPPMNWRLSMLDRYAIVSNSDAIHRRNWRGRPHVSIPICPIVALYDALKTRDPERFLGTLEFYPEEGKYHLDGHRKCGICWEPRQSLDADCLCPECGKRLTVGVLHRVEKLADREEGGRPDVAPPYENLIPLPEIIGSVLGVGPTSKRVQGVYERLLADLGPELTILRDAPLRRLPPPANRSWGRACGECGPGRWRCRRLRRCVRTDPGILGGGPRPVEPPARAVRSALRTGSADAGDGIQNAAAGRSARWRER